MMQKAPFLGINIDFLSSAEVLDKIKSFLKDDRAHQIITLNPEMVVRSQIDEEFRKILTKASLVIPDGIGIIWALRLNRRRYGKKQGRPERITGIDLIHKLAEKTQQEERFFLFGGMHGVATKAKERLTSQYPEIKIVGTIDGFDVGNKEAIKTINRAKPNILLVALGSPKQEKWIAQNLPKLPSIKVAIGIGGTFDFLSGRIKRAPFWMRKLGLEWLWRLLRQPWRARRIYKAVIKFPLLVFKDRFLNKSRIAN